MDDAGGEVEAAGGRGRRPADVRGKLCRVRALKEGPVGSRRRGAGLGGAFNEGSEWERPGDGGEVAGVGGPAKEREHRDEQRSRGAGFADQGFDAGGPGAKPPAAEPQQRGRDLRTASGFEGAGRRERWRVAGAGRRHDEDGDAAGTMGCVAAAGVIRGNGMEDNGAVGAVAVVAMGEPAAGPQVEFDIAADEVAIDIEDGVLEIGAAAAGGDAGKDDAQERAVFEAEGRMARVGPGGGEVPLGGREDLDGGAQGGSPGSSPVASAVSASMPRRRAVAPRGW